MKWNFIKFTVTALSMSVRYDAGLVTINNKESVKCK